MLRKSRPGRISSNDFSFSAAGWTAGATGRAAGAAATRVLRITTGNVKATRSPPGNESPRIIGRNRVANHDRAPPRTVRRARGYGDAETGRADSPGRSSHGP